MNGILGDTDFAWLLLAEGVFSSVNWLWIGSSAIVAWMIVSAMGRRQSRLTSVLRDHVKQQQNESAPPPEPDEP